MVVNFPSCLRCSRLCVHVFFSLLPYPPAFLLNHLPTCLLYYLPSYSPTHYLPNHMVPQRCSAEFKEEHDEVVVPCCARFIRVWLFATVKTIAHQALSMGLSRQEYGNGLPCPPPGDLPNPGIEPMSLTSPALAGRFFTTSTTWEALSTSRYSSPITSR